jgi:Arc-like DNA binding dprotein
MAHKPNDLRPIMTRLPERLRADLERSAKRNDRSMNAEIIHRLLQSFADQQNLKTMEDIERDLRSELAAAREIIADRKNLSESIEQAVLNGMAKAGLFKGGAS